MNNKNEFISFRVTKKEKQIIKSNADKSGKKISDFIRELALLSDEETIKNISEINKMIKELTVYIHRSANNINQIRQIKNNNAYDDDIKSKLITLADETENIYDIFLNSLKILIKK